MPLIKTVSEVKEVLPKYISNTYDPKMLPNFEQAEAKYLVPVVGPALYEVIHTKYNSNAVMSENEKALLRKMRMVVAANAFLDEMALGLLVLTENGLKKFTSGQTAQMYRWEYEKQESNLKNTAADALEVLLLFLFEKKFEEWTGSSAYQDYSRLLIKTGTEFHSFYPLYQPMRTFYFIRAQVMDVQELYLKEALGEVLLQHLLSVENPDDKLKQGLFLLKKALAYFTIKQCCLHYNTRFSVDGFTVMSGDSNTELSDNAGRKNVDAQILQLKLEACEKQGQDFLSRAQKYLVDYYKSAQASADYKTALEASTLKDYVNPEERDSGNYTHKIFVLN